MYSPKCVTGGRCRPNPRYLEFYDGARTSAPGGVLHGPPARGMGQGMQLRRTGVLQRFAVKAAKRTSPLAGVGRGAFHDHALLQGGNRVFSSLNSCGRSIVGQIPAEHETVVTHATSGVEVEGLDVTSTPTSISVFVAAPVRLYREGVAEMLRRQQGIDVLGTAGGPSETLAGVRELAPDLVLLDPALRGAIETIRELAEPELGVRVAALASEETEAEVLACAEAGVSGFVAREDSLEDLLAAVRAGQGESHVSPRTAATLLRRVATAARQDNLSAGAPYLTPREVEVLHLIEEGLTNKQIAGRLSVALPTVKQHVHHILDKLEVHRRGEAAARLRDRQPMS